MSLGCFKDNAKDKSSVEYILVVIGMRKVPCWYCDSMIPIDTKVNKHPRSHSFGVEENGITEKDKYKKTK